MWRSHASESFKIRSGRGYCVTHWDASIDCNANVWDVSSSIWGGSSKWTHRSSHYISIWRVHSWQNVWIILLVRIETEVRKTIFWWGWRYLIKICFFSIYNYKVIVVRRYIYIYISLYLYICIHYVDPSRTEVSISETRTIQQLNNGEMCSYFPIIDAPFTAWYRLPSSVSTDHEFVANPN